MGRTVYKPKGASWTPLLKGSVDAIHADDHVVGWELFGQQAIRKGEWKAVFVPAPSGKDRWEVKSSHNPTCLALILDIVIQPQG